MNQIKATKILNLNIDESKRLIFVSDIHGDVDTFKKGLEKINFSDDDYLFIIGDIIEKGEVTKNLETLLYAIELSKKANVYFMAGNCDEVFRFILSPDSDSTFLYYTLKKKRSILNDIALKMNVEITKDMNVRQFVNDIFKSYEKEISFLDNLPDVLFINNKLVLVHGGIDDINHIPTNAIDVLKYDKFYEKSKPQEKLMIVGHYPTRNYRADISSCNPIFDLRKRIISIDGGNQIVKGGQINFVMLESLSSMRFSFAYTDHYEKLLIKEDILYEKPLNNFNITYGDNEVEILDTDLDFFFIKHLKTNEVMWVHNSFVYQGTDGHLYCYDGSNQFISLHKNDEISIIKKAKPYSLIKKDGLIGLVETRYIENDF